MASRENMSIISTPGGLERAMREGTIVEARVTMCDTGHNLLIDLEGKKGIIPREETAIGVAEGKTREIAIISRVGKPVCFKVMGIEDGVYQLSRRQAQLEALDWMLNNLTVGQVIPCRVTHLESFGVFVDVGCGNISFIGIENISVSRISHPQERFAPRQDIYAVVLDIDPGQERITLSHRELLGTWEENCQALRAGTTVSGIVRGVEAYGAFVEITPNLSGLAEVRGDLKIGSHVAVFIKSVIPEKMKIKLVIIDTLDELDKKYISPEDYKITSGRLFHWVYSPEACTGKRIETLFARPIRV